MISDAPAGRAQETALRDLLRRLERMVTASHPARPNPASAPAALFSAELDAPNIPPVTVGDWTLSQDPDSGDLIATHSVSGNATLIARKDN